MRSRQYLVNNGAGWHLSLHQTYDPERLRIDLPPILIVPGYGMNSFIFSFHPRGVSLEGHLAAAGFEVWRADLRGQGGSVDDGGGHNFSLADLAVTDLKVAIEAVLGRSETRADRVRIIGASLGGSLMFAHLALVPGHRVDAMVAMGSPVRWEAVHPLVRVAFSSPTLAGWVRFRGTRQLVRRALPHLVARVPWLLSIYMNPEITDTSAAEEMVKTVEDPNRYINREIAHWIRRRDLVVGGVNVSDALRSMKEPLLCVVAVGDGVVPRKTAAFPFHQIGSPHKTLVEVGDDLVAMAHADLFVSTEAHQRVFEPISSWLLALP
jgi:pimeloyl-ACP methyl ester carboxylesterase